MFTNRIRNDKLVRNLIVRNLIINLLSVITTSLFFYVINWQMGVDMESNLHSLLLSTQSLFHKKVFSKLNGSGLTAGQPKILDYLNLHDGCIQRNLALACEIEPATVTSLLMRMEEAGLIERKMLNGNRRQHYVFLTDKGRVMAESVCTNFSELEEVAFDGFSKGEREDFLKQFERIYNNLIKNE